MIKELLKNLKKPIPYFESWDLKKRFPGYFNINVFRAFFFVLFLLVCADFVLNDYHLSSIKLECPLERSSPCINPVYECEAGEYEGCSFEVPEAYCPEGLCHLKTLPQGFYYGRSDVLATQPELLIFIIILYTFIINHLVYVYYSGNWRYKRK